MTCCALRRSKSNASGDAALGRSSHHSRRQLRDRADHEDPASALAPKLTFVMFFSGWLFWAFAQHRSASASAVFAARIASSTPSSRDSIWNGKPAPSTYLHKQLDVTVVLRLSPAPVAQTAHHQRDRALLRGSATENPTYGVLCERRKCGPH